MSTKPFRYQLPKKAIKLDCPQCGPRHRKTLSRYVDSQTSEALPEAYGRCDRESNCGYHLSPYTKDGTGLSYADQVNQSVSIPREWFKLASQWKRSGSTAQGIIHTLQTMQGATYEQAARVASYIGQGSPTRQSVPEASVNYLPDEVFNKSLGQYNQNQFAQLLYRHFGIGVAHELLSQFHVGTSAYWNRAGACVFWLIDEQGRKRGGQIKLFDESFHTAKYVTSDGQKRSRTSWVHTALAHHFQQQQQTSPDWLISYVKQSDFAPCLFGLPQLSTQAVTKPIALVEAPKTAVLCTPYFPQFIWLAVIGRSYLNADRLAPLKGRNIVLFPDLAPQGRDYAYWMEKAKGLRQQGFNVVVSDYLEQRATDEEKDRGLDLADYLLSQWKGYPPNWDH